MSASESYTLETCGDILQETIGLLEVVKRSAPPTACLQTLLGNHFASNDFHSFCCFGHTGRMYHWNCSTVCVFCHLLNGMFV
jgi:hypothetical protein